MYEEKIATLTAIVEAVAGRVPVITGASEYDARRAIRYGQAAAKAGANGLMLLPPMVYVPRPDAPVQHFRSGSEAVPLPVIPDREGGGQGKCVAVRCDHGGRPAL